MDGPSCLFLDEKYEKVKESIRKKTAEYLDRMEQLKKVLEDRKTDPSPKKQPTGTTGKDSK